MILETDSLAKNKAAEVPKVDLPPLDRKYALMYLLVVRGQLEKSDVQQLADVLYHDSREGWVRSLREVSQEAGLLPRWNRNEHAHNRTLLATIRKSITDRLLGKEYEHDAFLNHVVPRYSLAEMELTYTPAGFQNEYLPWPRKSLGFVDALSGSGPARPLLKELYSLQDVGLASVIDEPNPYDPKFLPTFGGRELASTLSLIYHLNARSWPADFILVLYPYEREAQRRAVPPDQTTTQMVVTRAGS